MDRNKVDIKLLQENPEELILKYQGVIWTVVRNFDLGKQWSRSDQEDLVQEINKKMLERLPRIRKQYNYTSKFRTYFSVIVKNMILEEFRRPAIVSEPDPEPYQRTRQVAFQRDQMTIADEYERFKRILILMDKDGARLNILMRVLNDTSLSLSHVTDLSDKYHTTQHANQVYQELLKLGGASKREKYERLADLLKVLTKKRIPPDSLRKWYTSRTEKCVMLMNGNPPRSAFDAETLGILIEKMTER